MVDRKVTSGLQTRIEISASATVLWSKIWEIGRGFPCFVRGLRSSINSIGLENCVKYAEGNEREVGCSFE